MFVIGNFKHNIVELPEQSINKIEKNGIRLYSTPEGIFPSVTSVVGWEKNKKFANWRENNKSESKRVCDRGNNLHSKIENYLLNESVNEESDELFKLIKPEVDKINNIRAIETTLWGKIIGLAGRVDCIAEYEKELAIIDFKASTYPKKKIDIDNYFCQAAAYSLLWQERTGEKVNKIIILMANEQGFVQVFKADVMDWITKLKDCIDTYKKEVNVDGIIVE